MAVAGGFESPAGGLVFFEAPHRLRQTLEDVQAVLGRPASCCRPGADKAP